MRNLLGMFQKRTSRVYKSDRDNSGNATMQEQLQSKDGPQSHSSSSTRHSRNSSGIASAADIELASSPNSRTSSIGGGVVDAAAVEARRDSRRQEGSAPASGTTQEQWQVRNFESDDEKVVEKAQAQPIAKRSASNTSIGGIHSSPMHTQEPVENMEE